MLLHLPLALCTLNLVAAPEDPSGEPPRHYPHSTVKISQLTADLDKTRQVQTLSLSDSQAGLRGTDLGCTFEHDGKLWFLFGDCRGSGDRDAMAWSNSTDPDQLVLHFPVGEDGEFRPIDIPGVKMGAYEVPSHGISVDGSMYLVTTAGTSKQKTMERSLLVRSDDEGGRFKILYELSRDAFINVALVRANREQHPSLPIDDAVLVWGSGDYRRSSPKFACIPAADIGKKDQLLYFAGAGESGPLWTKQESEAVYLFDEPCIGELTVSWVEPLGRWVMLYKGKRPTGIVMRSATQPWGPWSEPEEIFNPWEDLGYGNFLHSSWKNGRKDNFHDNGHENRWGGPYAPYVIDRFTTGDSKRCRLYFTMSTWNPYQVVLMSTELGYPDHEGLAKRVSEKSLPTQRPWKRSAKFLRKFEEEGVPYVGTAPASSDVEMGVAHRAIEASPDGLLEFTLRGGRGEVVLVRESETPPGKIKDVKAFRSQLKRGDFGQVVEAVAGPGSEDVELEVRWHLGRHVGHPLRLYLVDALRGKWGFVNVSEMTLSSSE